MKKHVSDRAGSPRCNPQSQIEIALGVVDAAPDIEAGGLRRIEPDRFVVVGEGAIIVVLGAIEEAPDFECGGVCWIEPDRFAVVGEGAIIIALVAMRDAANEERTGIFRVEPDRLVVIRDGAVVLFLVGIRAASEEEGVSVVRIEPDRLIAIVQRAIEVPFRVPHCATIGVGDRLLEGRFNRIDNPTACGDVLIRRRSIIDVIAAAPISLIDGAPSAQRS
jgi:hypothetical protein